MSGSRGPGLGCPGDRLAASEAAKKGSSPLWPTYSVGVEDVGYYVPLFDIYLGSGPNIVIANDYLKLVCKEIGVYYVAL